MSDIKDLIQHALDQDYNKASEVFGQVMSIKTQEVLDQAKVKLAGQIYNGEEAEEDNGEDEELEAMSDEELDAAFDEAGEELGDDDESEEDEVSEEEENEASDGDEEQ